MPCVRELHKLQAHAKNNNLQAVRSKYQRERTRNTLRLGTPAARPQPRTHTASGRDYRQRPRGDTDPRVVTVHECPLPLHWALWQ
eukprot:1677508-Prymnesium_polylepis.1